MLGRELTYRMPFERLAKLSRSAGRKAFAKSWYLYWAMLAGYLAGLALIIIFSDRLARLGPPWFVWLGLLVAIFIAALWGVRRVGRQQIRERADYDGIVQFREEAGGLRFETSQIAYSVKWNGISQLLLEPDGVVFSHGSLFFLVPDSAFADLKERNALIRDVFERLGPEARERSESFIRPVLDAAAKSAEA